jgi:hypothetical protein
VVKVADVEFEAILGTELVTVACGETAAVAEKRLVVDVLFD